MFLLCIKLHTCSNFFRSSPMFITYDGLSPHYQLLTRFDIIVHVCSIAPPPRLRQLLELSVVPPLVANIYNNFHMQRMSAFYVTLSSQSQIQLHSIVLLLYVIMLRSICNLINYCHFECTYLAGTIQRHIYMASKYK